jgi:prepilin-type N-terminal cleavage/methylation domain-containing protein
MENSKGFTLIELLVIIAIIGILSTFLYIGFSEANKSARDAIRKADVDTYAKALMMEKTIGSEQFPKEETICCLDAEESNPLHCDNVMSSPKMMEIMKAIPTDPLHEGNTDHCYRYISNGSSATITVPLERGEIYTYVLGDKSLTETSSSTLSLTVLADPPAIGGSWSRGTDGGDKSIIRMQMDNPPLLRTDGEEVVDSMTESFNDTGLSYDKKYCYTLWNYNSGDDLYSKAYSSCATTYPAPVISMEATPASSSSVDLSWTKADPGYSTIIRRGASSAPQSVTEGDSVYIGTENVTYTDNGLSAGTTYYYSAFSHNDSTNLDSAPISYSVITGPAIPTVSAGATSSSSIGITFSIPNGADSIYIRYLQGSTPPSSLSDGVLIGNENSSPYSHGSLSSNTSYCYSIWGYNSTSSLYSSSFATACATTLIATPSTPSLSVSATGSSSISITYNLPINAIRTEIIRVSPSNTWTQTSGTSFVDSGLSPSTEYCYRARSCNSQGSCSEYTSNQCTTTMTPINGICPSVTNSYTTPTATCISGNPSVVTGTGPWTWTCSGIYGGSASGECLVNKSINGTCGSANGKLYEYNVISYGSDTQCSIGNSSNTSFPAQGQTVNWTCSGVYGGTGSSCSASRKPSEDIYLDSYGGSWTKTMGLFNWNDGKSLCSNLSYGGYGAGSWSLPTRYQINQCLNSHDCKWSANPWSRYWSADVPPMYPTDAYVVIWYDTYSETQSYKTNGEWVRCRK